MDCPAQPRRVILTLDDDPDAIHGTLEHADGTRERFWGWLDLMSALDGGNRDSLQQQAPRADGVTTSAWLQPDRSATARHEERHEPEHRERS
jgi:hypothetical protein